MTRSMHSAAALILGGSVVALSIATFACGSSSNDGAGAGAATSDAGAGAGDSATNRGDGGGSSSALVAARPYNFKVPSGYDKTKATPLVILLHGYGASGVEQEAYFQLGPQADADTFLYAYPDGTLDSSGKRYWNADDACCAFLGPKVDDVAYVNAIIDDVESKYNVDTKRVFVIGHSNGAFMSHRLACDSSDRIAAIVSLAGAVWNDPSECTPSSKISVLDVHGDADMTIAYGGGTVATGVPNYPGELATMATWAGKNGCSGALTGNASTLDLDSLLAGSETTEQAYAGCPTGIDVALWTIHGGSHIPNLTHPTWATSVFGFFKAHPKP
ncbi:MAG: alpha/beta fold hydrolase [Polyangiaceae bacterium]